MSGTIQNAKDRLFFAGKLIKYYVTLLNRRGTFRDAPSMGFDKGRVLGFRFTDKDIREAEAQDPKFRKVFKMGLSLNGKVERIRDKNVKPDALMYCTITTLASISQGRMTMQQAIKLRLVQVRYLNKVLEQEEEFIKDVGYRLRFFNDLVEEVLKDGGVSFPKDDR